MDDTMYVVTSTNVVHGLDEAMQLIEKEKKAGCISSILEVEK